MYELSTEISNALKGLGYEEPTNVQREVIPLVLEQKDLIVKSHTGSGKTAAYGIPICEKVNWLENKPQALILTPTRELAVQVKEDLTNIGRFKRIKVAMIFGGQPFDAQKLVLKQKTHIVVGTPGRILDHMERDTIALDGIRYLVIDEADEMLNMGFIEQVESIVGGINKNRVTLLFSATLPEAIQNLTRRYMTEPTQIEVDPGAITTNLITHERYKVGERDKLNLLIDVTTVENPDSCILFCQTQDKVNGIYKELKRKDYNIIKIHGGMRQEDRLEAMQAFKNGEFRYLIATDVAARGIDVENISLVINYDVPHEKEGYVHRTGRTGRAGLEGKAITFVTLREEGYFSQIEEYIEFEIPVAEPPSKEDVFKYQEAFEQKMKEKQNIRRPKSRNLNKNIMKIYFNGGKKKKLRAIDFVGTIAKIEGLTVEDIGIITIMDTFTHVEILNGKGQIVLEAMKETKVKGKLLRVFKAKG